jgi:cytosolic carboxypeptidase protein 2/3
MVKSIYKHHREKTGIVVSARVHPGEAQSSWVVQGFIKFLLSDDPVARQLRSQYIFKIVPMLNPDGVIYGNYRWSLLGFDLNRRWLEPSKQLDPTIYFTKRMFKVFQEERRVMAYFDLHGHSRKKNAFMYGCDYFGMDSRQKNLMLRSLPALFDSLSKIFKFSNWSFRVEKNKEKTGRVVWFKEFGIMHSFTLETSFFGREKTESDTDDTDLHMGTEDFEQLGVDLAKTISHYQNEEYMQALENVKFEETEEDKVVEESKFQNVIDTVLSSFKSKEKYKSDFPDSDGFSSDSDDEETNILSEEFDKK